MSFRGLLRPGQGFKPFLVFRRDGGKTITGRPRTVDLQQVGEFFGIITQASPKEQEQWKQLGNPITHTIVQRGTTNRARANDILALKPTSEEEQPSRFFLVKGEPQNPGELGHFLIYRVEERADLT